MSSDLRSEELFKIASNKNEFLIDVEHRQTDTAVVRIAWRTINTAIP